MDHVLNNSEQGGPLARSCCNVLGAYTMFRPDVGYVQGMSFIVAVLLLYLDEYKAFVVFANLINRSGTLLGSFKLEPLQMRQRYDLFWKVLAENDEALERKVKSTALRAEFFLVEWFLTVFAKTLSVDLVSAVWDLFFLDEEPVLYQTAVAIFISCRN